MARQKFILFTVFLLLFLTACLGAPSPTSRDDQATQVALALTQTAMIEESTKQAQIQEQATSDALSTSSAQAALDAQATLSTQGTSTAIAQVTQQAMLDATSTAIQVEASQQTATAKADQQATAQVKPIYDYLQKLQESGEVTDISGSYLRLPDYERTMSRIGYFGEEEPIGFTLENFAIRADASWDSASDMANWNQSGCTFLIGVDEQERYDMVFLSLDGFAKLYLPVLNTDRWQEKARERYGKLSIPKGGAEVMIGVINKRIIFYVNGVEVLSEYDGNLRPGDVYFAIISGTNKDYGIRCKMENIDLWIFD